MIRRGPSTVMRTMMADPIELVLFGKPMAGTMDDHAMQAHIASI